MPQVGTQQQINLRGPGELRGTTKTCKAQEREAIAWMHLLAPIWPYTRCCAPVFTSQPAVKLLPQALFTGQQGVLRLAPLEGHLAGFGADGLTQGLV